MGRVQGKICIVTGAASGLGEASARLLVEHGAQVVIADIDEERGTALADQLGDSAMFVHHDVRSEQAWIDLIGLVVNRFGRLDVLVNNAGVVVVADVERTSEESWRFVHAVGTDGTFYGCKHAIPRMREGGGGSIINLSSVSALIGHPLVFAYAASKGAIRSMTKSIAVHCAQHQYRIRCNSIHPGGFDTPMVTNMLASARPGEPSEVLKEWTRPVLGQPEDVGYMVLYLASDESRFVNGAEFVIDNTATITEGHVPG